MASFSTSVPPDLESVITDIFRYSPERINAVKTTAEYWSEPKKMSE